MTKHVWELFRLAWQRTGGTSTLLEWDGNIPAFDVYHAELLKAKEFMSGDFNGLSDAEEELPVQEEVSNPIHFMVSETRDQLEV